MSAHATTDTPLSWGAALAALCAGTILVGALYFHTLAGMVAHWKYTAHQVSFLILPLAAYFVWLRREDLLRLRPRPVPALAWLALPCGALWLIADAAQVAFASQLAVVALLQIMVLAVLGTRLARLLLFPLLLLWLLVPFGEGALPVLVEATFRLTVASLRLAGFQVATDGNRFTVAGSSYDIISDCASLDFVIGNLVISLTFANLIYSGFWRRALYVAAAIPVAILANIVRTSTIVMITEASGGRIDLGVDHRYYSLLIFGLAILAQMRLGLFFHDVGTRPGRAIGADRLLCEDPAPARPKLRTAIGLLALLLALPPVYAGLTTHGGAELAPPLWCSPAWLAAGSPTPGAWRPVYRGAESQWRGQAMAAQGSVEVFMATFDERRRDAKMIGGPNEVYDAAAWHPTSRTTRRVALPDARLPVIETRIRAADGSRRLIWHWYWVDGRVVANAALAKLFEAKAALGLAARRSAVIALSLAETDDRTRDEALLAAVTANHPQLARMLAGTPTAAGCAGITAP